MSSDYGDNIGNKIQALDLYRIEYQKIPLW